MIKDRVDECLRTFKKRQDHLATVMQDGSSLSADDMSDSEKVTYISGRQSYIVDDGDISYLIVDANSCYRLEPYFEITDECVNLGVDTHQAQLIPGPGLESMVVRLIPARPDYEFNFIESEEIQNLIDPRLVSCMQSYFDDLNDYLAGYVENAIYHVLPKLNAQFQQQADELDVSFESIVAHESVLKLLHKVVNDITVDAAEKYAGLVDDAYGKLVSETAGISEKVDDVLEYGALLNSDVSDLQIDIDNKDWKKIDMFGEWPDGEVEVSLILLMNVAIEDTLKFISKTMEESLANSIMNIMRLIKQAAESSEMTEDELMHSSFMRVVLTRNMKTLVSEGSEKAIAMYDEESEASIDESDVVDGSNDASLETEGEVVMNSIAEIIPNSSEAYVAACAAVMVCDNEIDEAELTESIKAAMKSNLMIELVKTLGSKNKEIEHSLSGLSVDDYKEVLEQLTNREADDTADEGVDEFNALVNEFDPQASLLVIANVKAAWAAANEDDSEFELLDLIASKIGSDLSPWVLSSCLDIAKADGKLQNEEETVLGHFASKWGQEDYLCKMLQVFTGKTWSMLDVAGRRMLLSSEDKEEVVEEKSEVSELWKAIMEMDAHKAIKLVEAGAPANDLIDFNSEIRDISPLMIAAEQFDERLVQALIDAGADINAKACVGYVPLAWALKGENIDNFRLLLAAGADINPLEAGKGGYSPLSMAVMHGLDVAVKELIDAGVSVDWTNEDGQTALKVAVMNQQAGCVRLLLDAGADPGIADNDGFAPIHNAAGSGDIDIVNMLLDAGVDVDTPLLSPAEDEGETALNSACYAGHAEVVKELIKRGARPGVAGNVLQDLIVGAYSRSEDPTETVLFLIDSGAKVGIKTLLHAVLVAPVATNEVLIRHLTSKADEIPSDWFEVANKMIAETLLKVDDEARRNQISNLLKVAGDVWVLEDAGSEEHDYLDLAEYAALSVDERLQQYPLWTAVTAGDVDVALKLAHDTVGLWSDVDEPAEGNGTQNITPLAMASGQQLPSFLKLLLDEGADINAMDSTGFVPLTYALQGEKMENFQLLIEAGANPDPIDAGVGRFSPLAMAADHGLVDAVKDLVKRGVNVNWVGAHGGDALKAAAANGQLECVELLIAAGANPASVDAEGFSPIHNAADNGHCDVVMKLLDAGVDVDFRVGLQSDDEGRTVLHRACSRGDLELVRKLVDRGASVNAVATDSSTPLLSAVLYTIGGSEDATGLIQYLLKMGAEPDLQLLFVALQNLPVPIFAEMLKILIPKMDSPLPFEDTELDRDGIANAFALIVREEADLQRRNDIYKILEESGFDISPTEEKDGVLLEDSGPAEAQQAETEVVNYMPKQADLDLDVDTRTVSLSDEEFDERWNRLIDIQNKIADNFIDELAEYQDQQTQEEYDTLMSYIGVMQDQNRHINETIVRATNRDLGRYAKSIKNAALVTLGLCQKYKVFNDIETYGYDADKKVVQISGEDFYYLGQ